MAVAVLTRDPGDAHAYARVLAPLGLETIAMPVTRTAGPPDPDALVRAVGEGDHAAIVVASARAAQELARAVAGREHLRALPEIWAVGPATRRALEAAGLPATLPDGVRDGAELATALVAARSLAGRRVLVPRAEDGRLEPLAILRAAGAEVIDVVAYRTVAAAADEPAVQAGADALAAGSAALCAVFAPSQVRALAAILDARGVALAALTIPFCAIGETTGMALRDAGVRSVVIAPAPTPEGMAQAVGSVYPPRA